MTSPAPGSTRDVVFLAVTRPSNIYGMPLGGFLLAAGAGGMIFNVTHAYNVWWRLGIVSAAVLATFAVMRALTSWEPLWLRILNAWAQTRARVLLSWPTRAFGGTTFRPWPVALRDDPNELRDHAG